MRGLLDSCNNPIRTWTLRLKRYRSRPDPQHLHALSAMSWRFIFEGQLVSNTISQAQMASSLVPQIGEAPSPKTRQYVDHFPSRP